MMVSYAKDRAWSDAFIPSIRRIVGPHLLVPAPMDLDCEQATDLLVFKARDVRIAARVRRPGFAERYLSEFTIRAHRDTGAKTELSKIVDGWGDWLFYGHAMADVEGAIADWWIIDLASFRAALIRDGHGFALRYGTKPNGDGTAFKWFDLRSFPEAPPILVAGSRPLASLQEAA